MKTLKGILAGLLLLTAISIIAQSFNVVSSDSASKTPAQALALSGSDVHSLRSLSDEQLAAFMGTLNASPTLSVDVLPRKGWGGTFWSLQHPDWPALPGDISGSSVWDMGGFYLVNDMDFDYDAAAARAQSRMQTMALDGPPIPGGGGDGGTNTILHISLPPIDYGSNLWIAQVSLTNGMLTAIASNTLRDVEYEIFTNADLTTTNWISSGQFILGSDTTNWTALRPLTVSLTNNLFVRLRSWADDGSGLPIWWQLEHFGMIGIDPDADPDGDGLSNWSEYEAGTDPTVFNIPYQMKDLTVEIIPPSTAVLTWPPAVGPVTGYTILRDDYYLKQVQTYELGPTNQFMDTNYIQYPPWLPPVTYTVKANYADGDTYYGTSMSDLRENTSTAKILSGAGGTTVLSVIGLPSDAIGVQATRADWSNYSVDPPVISGSNTYFIEAGALTNGVYTLPTNVATLGPDGSSWYIQTIWSNSLGIMESEAVYAGYLAAQTRYGYVAGSFNDASQQLEDNAIFLLRAAGLNVPFDYSFNAGSGTSLVNQPTNYVFASFFNMNSDTGDGLGYYPQLFWGLPFEENYRLRNFVFASGDINSSGFLNTGADLSFVLHSPYTFNYSVTNTTATADLLAPSDTTWIIPYNDPSQLGITNDSGYFSLPNNIYNFFGLKLLSVLVAHNHAGTLYLDTINAGGSLLKTNDTYYFYPNFEQPELETTGYYFGTPEFNYEGGEYALANEPFPGDTLFSPTNAQPLLLATVGTPLQIAAFARQTIMNGDGTKPVYVGQYFDKAYKIDTNGNVTDTQTGVLSPYGSFLPTEPGPVALVTLPASDGARGTSIVQVVSLVVDGNHDGNMDQSYYGNDFTTATHKMTFWANDLYNQPGNGTTLDKDFMVNVNQGNFSSDSLQPNYAFGQIRCQRNLENFARLWIRGMPRLPAGYSATLTWSGWGVNLYQAYDSGIGYLTDTNIAAIQVGAPYGDELASLSEWNTEYPLPMDGSGNLLITNFLFEGTIPDDAGFVLTIYKNGAPVARSQAYAINYEARDLYERAHIAGVPTSYPAMIGSTNASTFVADNELESNPYETKQLITFVHGWRMTQFDYQDFSDTMFKRLYWAGYQGRFASLRWPTLSSDDFRILSDLLSYTTYNRSEYIAFDSGAGTCAYLDWLKNRLPDYSINVAAHSMGNIVMMEALKDQLAEGHSVIDNYVMMQAAVPAQCYDTGLANYSVFTAAEADNPTPDIYRGYPGNIAAAVNNQIVDFFNTNDFALATGFIHIPLIGNVQANWEENQITYKPDGTWTYFWDGTNCFSNYLGLRDVTNPHEQMAFVARPRAKAAGALGGVGGVVKTAGQVDLNAVYGFDRAASDHSAEFNRTFQQLGGKNGFYSTLLDALFPTTP